MPRGKKKTSFNFNKKKLEDTAEVLQPSDKVETIVVDETHKQMDIDPIEIPECSENIVISCAKVENTTDVNSAINESTLNGPVSEITILSDIDFDLSPPIGLQNSGDNVCFFNSIIQILISFSAYQNHIMETMIDNPVISTL